MNKVIFIGNLTRDVELGTTPNGVSVAKFSIAVNRRFSNADGERVTDFFNIVVWRGQAENCAKYLKKGSKVGIVGELQTRSYEDKDGVKRYVTEVQADEVEFLSAKQEQESDAEVVTAKRERPQIEAIDDNQLPF